MFTSLYKLICNTIEIYRQSSFSLQMLRVIRWFNLGCPIDFRKYVLSLLIVENDRLLAAFVAGSTRRRRVVLQLGLPFSRKGWFSRVGCFSILV